MAVPNLSAIVESIRATYPPILETAADVCAYAHDVVVALHAEDAHFGHLRKSEAQNHCTDPTGAFVGVDVTLYQPTGQVVDFIVSAGPGGANSPSWGEGPEGEYGASDWIAPTGGTDTEPPPVDPPDDSDLEARVAALEAEVGTLHSEIAAVNAKHDALHNELVKQIGLLNAGFAKLDRRTYAGSAKVPFLGNAPVVCNVPIDN